jgi:UDP-2,3-diacylglucosamine pyrophosphatase LpxH
MTYRSIWISDIHLGSKHARVGALLDFLRHHDSQHLYIVGDFIDGWELSRRWYWRDEYNVLIQKLLRKSRKDTRVTFIVGNHDEFLQHFLGLRFGSVRLVERCLHTGADGRKYLVLHGHQFDGLVTFNRLLERVGSRLYDWILDFNLLLNRIRRRLGFGYWSVAAYLKFKAKSAVKYVTQYEEAMVGLARTQRVQGVICGHIHRAEIRDIQGIRYLNSGDWVESCTALVEEHDGTMRLVHWADPVSGTASSGDTAEEGAAEESTAAETEAGDLHEGVVHRAGRGSWAHDAGDGGGGDAPSARPRGRGRDRRDESQQELAGLF